MVAVEESSTFVLFLLLSSIDFNMKEGAHIAEKSNGERCR